MEMHAIPLGGRPILPYHDHNGAKMRPKLMKAPEATGPGWPMSPTPGHRSSRIRGISLRGRRSKPAFPVTAAPGPSAALVALTVSGLPSDRFLFAGFPPSAAGARRAWIASLDDAAGDGDRFRESQARSPIVSRMCETLGEDRNAALCRELTKRFEEVRRAPLGQLRDRYADDPPKGECVLVIDRGGETAVRGRAARRPAAGNGGAQPQGGRVGSRRPDGPAATGRVPDGASIEAGERPMMAMMLRPGRSWFPVGPRIPRSPAAPGQTNYHFGQAAEGQVESRLSAERAIACATGGGAAGSAKSTSSWKTAERSSSSR
jgi:hypothetical protein